MARFRTSFGRILTLGGLAAASGSIAAYQSLVTEKTAAQSVVENYATTEEKKKLKTQWDSDWDKRNHYDLKNKILSKNITVQREKVIEDGFVKEEKENKESSKNEKVPKATRHLILVRHGQYCKGETDEERKLTELGR